MASPPRYDVFLSHNSSDKPQVEQIGDRLIREANLQPFLDKWHLVPGEEWQPDLADALEQSATVAVFFGPCGSGPWHHEEMQLALMRAVRERLEYRVIPVILPNADASSIPAFLQLRTWVDFRPGINNDIAFRRLVAGIRGQATECEGILLPDEPAPYRGLMHFEADHARFFFGREQDIGPTKDTPNLLDKLRVNRFVAVVGSSGSGKSSIVRAGLLPRLAQGAIPSSGRWRTIVFTPVDDPFRSLANALVGQQPASERGRIVTQLLAQFDEPENGLRDTLETWFADTTDPLLLFIDQFEELFTHAPPSHTSAKARERYDERIGRFVRQLVSAVLRPDGRFRSIITVRADFIPHCLRYPELKNLLQDRQMLLGELAKDDEALREVIQRPAHEVGAMLETGLMELLLGDVHRQSGALPLLAHALSELWRARRGPWLTLDAYRDSGGVSGALERRAEETLQRLSGPQQQIARRIFVKLTSLEEDTEDSRRRVDRKALYAETADRAEIDAVINTLTSPDSRLIVADEYSLSIAHETLIRNWPRLRTWLDEDRRLERIHRELKHAANDWEAHARSKRYLFHAASAKLAETEEQVAVLADRITPSEGEFLATCCQERDAEAHRLRRRLYIVASIACIAVIAMSLAVCQWHIAVHAQSIMEDALVASFYRTIGIGAPIDQREALWELAQLENVNVKRRLVDQWFDSGKSVDRCLMLDAAGARAAVGTDLAMHHHIALRSKEFFDIVAERTEDDRQWEDLPTVLAPLARWMRPDDTTTVAARGADHLAESLTTEKIRRGYMGESLAALAGIMEPINPNGAAAVAARGADALAGSLQNAPPVESELNDAFAKLAARMDAEDAGRVAERLARVMIEAKTPQYDLPPIAGALKPLAGKMEARQAARIGKDLAEAMCVVEIHYDRLRALGSVLGVVARKMKAGDAARVGQTMVMAMENEGRRLGDRVLKRRVDWIGFWTRLLCYAEALNALAGNMEPAEAEIVARRGGRMLTKALEIDETGIVAGREKPVLTKALKIDGAHLSSLGDVLSALADKMDPKEAASVTAPAARALAEALERGGPRELLGDRLGWPLAALAGKMELTNRDGAAALAKRGGETLVKALESEDDLQVDYLTSLGEQLAALVARMDCHNGATIAARGARALAKRGQKPQMPSGYYSDLGHAIKSLAARIDSEDAASLAACLSGALEDGQMREPGRRLYFNRALPALATKMNDKDVSALADRLSKALERPQVADADQLECLGCTIEALAAKVSPRDAARLCDRLSKTLDDRDTRQPLKLRSLRRALVALAAKMEPQDVGKIADRLANSLKNSAESANRLEIVGSALALLAGKMDPEDAVSVAARGAWALAKAMQEDSVGLPSLGISLGGLSMHIPSARRTRLFALSNILLDPIPPPPREWEEEREQRTSVVCLCARLDKQDLADVLKWPFSGGEAEQIVLAELARKTGGEFRGELRRFVEQAKSLGIKNLSTPARRPCVQDALDELKTFVCFP